MRTPLEESRIKEIRNADVVGAIRLALVGADSPETAVKVIGQLCDYAPQTSEKASGPVELLLDAIRDAKGDLTVKA
jgi:hypothetical protein